MGNCSGWRHLKKRPCAQDGEEPPRRLKNTSKRPRRSAIRMVSAISPPRDRRSSRQAGVTMASLEIIPMTPDHIDSYHRTLDFIARERRYLAFLEAPPLESTRAFVL